MSNTHNNTALSVINAGLVIAGITMLVQGTKLSLWASSTSQSGQGTLAGQQFVGEAKLLQGILRPAAPATSSMGPELALGMLLILLGCALHALLVLRNQKPLNTSVTHKVDSRDLGGIRRYMEVFWIDIRK